MPFIGPHHSYFTRRHYHKKFAERRKHMEEFKALLHTVPTNPAQMRWVCRALDDFERKYPELEPQIVRVLEAYTPREEP